MFPRFLSPHRCRGTGRVSAEDFKRATVTIGGECRRNYMNSKVSGWKSRSATIALAQDRASSSFATPLSSPNLKEVRS